ncbi:four-carbon acid sugar kinase family protein [Nocardiopsis sp. JB363]|uniref:four-carbon acid sugar kinase family protein n=1 Tax=Nocardiopsis sp. JB363 TaxID=1434837 RepID=UPI000979C82D|nr:four-carbon acid sugar kinase family protein [Nocardiopsis sp. JB363]SIO87803.1 Candidate type III effector Hop protein [Nocardiopsis sp. JB363]
MSATAQNAPSAPHIAVVADDLTGAGDTAVQFVRAGWRTELQLTPADATADVVAVTTDSRALSDERAAETAAAEVRRLREAGTRLLYKKVDSTLRGPIRAEIDGALSEWHPGSVAVVCPAFPANGRIVRDGVLLVDGVEVHRTAVGSDPVSPVTESRVAELLDARHVRLSGAEPEQDAEQLRAAGPVAVVDAESDEDLARLAAAITLLGERVLPVGSAGLATRLAESWRPMREPAPALVVVTSLHQAARGQVRELVVDEWTRVEQPTTVDLGDDEAWRSWSDKVVADFDPTCPHTALVAPDDRDGGLSPALVARRFGTLASRLAELYPLSGFVVTGGDGARALTEALRARSITLTGEVAPGIPLGTLTGGPHEGRSIVTKAGGFGSPNALIEAADAVRHTKGTNA